MPKKTMTPAEMRAAVDAFKAKFTLSAVAPGNQTAFSNMPSTQVTKQQIG